MWTAAAGISQRRRPHGARTGVLLVAILCAAPGLVAGSDFSVVSITSPPDSVPLDSQVVPTALIHAAIYNQSESVSVRMRIGTTYDHTTDTVIPAGAAINVTFPPWQAQPLGTTTARCSILAADNDSTNNVLGKQVHVIQLGGTPGEPQVLWMRTFSGEGSAVGRWVQQANDGGFVIAGWTSLPDTGWQDFYVVKTDSLGNAMWEKTFGGPDPEFASYVEQTRDGGYIVAGGAEPDGHDVVWLVKTDSTGTLEWQKNISSDTWQLGFSAQQTSDGGFIVCGNNRWSKGDTALYVAKTDSGGNLQWQRFYPRVNSPFPECLSIRQTADGGFVTTSLDGCGLWLVRIDPDGSLKWRQSFSPLKVGGGYGLDVTRDGGFVVTGVGAPAAESTYGSDAYLLRTDTAGNVIWVKRHGRDDNDAGYSVRQTSEGGFVVAGISNHPTGNGASAYLLLTDSLGNSLWELFLGPAGQRNSAECVQQTADGGFVATGMMSDPEADRALMFLCRIAQRRMLPVR
jgi:hypothetical protein